MAAIQIDEVSHHYGSRCALDRLSLSIGSGEIFALLGPNGSGKTTLFRLLTTLIPLQRGTITLAGFRVDTDPAEVRRRLGVVFQSPSLDLKLTVRENLQCQAALYGLSASVRSARIAEALAQLGIADRAEERAEQLSGGLRRRVDLARSILSEPAVLVLDEPTTALDPAARSDMWRYLHDVQQRTGTTILFTTHLLEEAEHAQRIAILDGGRLVVCDHPDKLKQAVGGDVLSIQPKHHPDRLQEAIQGRFAIPVELVDGRLRMECQDGHTWVPQLVQAFPDQIQAITMSKPTLEDVFVHHTGHRFWVETPAPPTRRKGHA